MADPATDLAVDPSRNAIAAMGAAPVRTPSDAVAAHRETMAELRRAQVEKERLQAPVYESMRRNAERDEVRATAAESRYQPIQEIKAPEAPENDPLKGFGSAAAVFAMIASAFTHTPAINAMNGLAGAINATKTNDWKAYDVAHAQWKEQTDLALQHHKTQAEDVKLALETMKTNIALGTSKLQVIAAQTGDKALTLAAIAGDADQIEKIQQGRAEAAMRMSENRIKVDEHLRRQRYAAEVAAANDDPGKLAAIYQQIARYDAAVTPGGVAKLADAERTRDDQTKRQGFAAERAAAGGNPATLADIDRRQLDWEASMTPGGVGNRQATEAASEKDKWAREDRADSQELIRQYDAATTPEERAAITQKVMDRARAKNPTVAATLQGQGQGTARWTPAERDLQVRGDHAWTEKTGLPADPGNPDYVTFLANWKTNARKELSPSRMRSQATQDATLIARNEFAKRFDRLPVDGNTEDDTALARIRQELKPVSVAERKRQEGQDLDADQFERDYGHVFNPASREDRIDVTAIRDAREQKPLSSEALEAMAAEFAAGVPMSRVVPGFGPSAVSQRAQVYEMAVKTLMDDRPDMTGRDAGLALAQATIDYTMARSASGNVAKIAAGTESTVFQLEYNIEQTKLALKALGTTDMSPLWNRFAVTGMKWTGDKNIDRALYFMEATMMESARLLVGGGASVAPLHEGAAKRAQEFASVYMTPAGFDNLAKGMIEEGAIRRKSFARVLENLKLKSDPSGIHAFPVPPKEAMDDLRANPALTGQFDDVFGIGAAGKVLGYGR